MLTIKDIVDLDQQAEFRSDVQLSAYDHPERNIALLRSYLFSTETPQRGLSEADYASPVDLLDKVVNTYLGTKAENRLVVIADYGHGKSHLALALANYFGKPARSPELKTVDDKLVHTLNDPAKASRYRDFKSSKGEFLLIRIRGDVPEALPAQFLSSLDQALKSNAMTKNIRPPFWHEQAETYLTHLSPEESARADAYLGQHDSQLPLLLQDIQAHRDVHDLAVEAIRAAKGVKPDLREISLARAVRWAVENLVGQDKPFGGILILFDEFTLFLNKYARRNGAADLQDLLNGVDDYRGRVTFVAFAQIDPETTAENLTLAGSSRADLKKALTRLQRKYSLYSLMESVIDAYLKQNKAAWSEFADPLPVRGRLTGASNNALICFKRRYDHVLRWPPPRFLETVTQGCFPLHPITTALLCTLKLESVDTGVPRNVLGFVMEQLQIKQAQPAYLGGDDRVNWVLPIALVDYFEDRLSGDAYRSYLNARRMLGIELTDGQEVMLKALLLYELGDINVRKDDQFEFLCQASGLERHVAGDALQVLVKSNSIRRDPSSKIYSLWPVTADPGTLERVLRDKLEQQRFNEQTLAKLNAVVAKDIPGISFGIQPLDVDWGHSSDWAAQEIIVSSDTLTLEALRKNIPRTQFNHTGTQEGARSYVLWAMARDEDEVQHFRAHAETVLDKAFGGESPIPVVLVLPEAPQPALVENFQRLQALGALNNIEIGEIGSDMVDAEKQRVQGEIAKAMLSLRGVAELPLDVLYPPSRLVVPIAYRASAKTLGETSLKQLLHKLYDLAYRWRPPTFDTRYQVASKGSNALRKSTASLAAKFFHDTSRTIQSAYYSDRFTRDLYERHLQKTWGILGPDFRLQKPKHAGLVQAWNQIDDTITPGRDGVRLSPLFEQLLNPPFGFDYNTAVLLFAAWFGYNSSDIRVSVNGSLAFDMQATFDSWLAKDAKEFTLQVHQNAVAVTRREPGEDERELKELLEGYAQKTYSPSEAQRLAENIQTLAAAKGIAQELQKKANTAVTDLQESAKTALQYADAAAAIEEELASGFALNRLPLMQRRLAGLHPDVLVTTDAPSPSTLAASLYRATETAARRIANQNSQLQTLGKYEWHRQSLLESRKIVDAAGFADLTHIFDEALSQLDAAHNKLVAEASEETLRAALRTMRVDISLAALYEQRNYLQELKAVNDSTIKLRDSKLVATEAEIRRLEEKAKSLCAGVLDQSSPAELRDSHASLMAIKIRYVGTPLAQSINDTEQLMGDYSHFLASLAEANQRIPALQEPEAFEFIAADLDRLEDENKAWIGEKQRAMLARARIQLGGQEASKKAEAETWLSNIESTRITDANLARLAKELQSPPRFLSEAQMARVEKLQVEVERQIDQSVVARIEQEFRRIRDLETRQACILRLQQLLEQEASEPIISGTK